jgi:hypothetical protein
MNAISRRTLMFLAASTLVVPLPARAAHMRVILYKNPQCDCCEYYAGYLRRNGFAVDVKPTNDLATMSRQAGVPEELEGCHISMIDGYVVEGHVPIAAIGKLLAERPAIIGITLPGMPMGSPGMTGKKQKPLVIYAVAKDGTARVYLTE